MASKPLNFSRFIKEAYWIFAFGLMAAAAGVVFSYFDLDLTDKDSPPLGEHQSEIVIAVMAGAMLAIRSFLDSRRIDSDVSDRRLAAELERMERDITFRVRRSLSSEIGPNIEEKIVSNLINQKIDDSIINVVDKSLSDRLSVAGQKIRVNTIFTSTSDLLKRKLDGPAGRSERNADFARRFAYFLAISGICLAAYRIFSGGEFAEKVIALIEQGKSNELYILMLMQAAPWIGLIVLIEFTALMLLRVYNRSIELQRYFTRELALYESKIASIIAINEAGTTEHLVAATKTFLDQESSVQVELAKKS